MNVLKHKLKGILKRQLGKWGIEIHSPNSGEKNQLGDMLAVLHAIKQRGFNPEIIVDVGANRGDWTREAISVFPESTFLLFEPQAEMKSSLDALCRKHNKVTWKQSAVGSEDGNMKLYVWKDLNGTSLLRPPKADHQEEREIPILSLDSFFQNSAKPNLVKLDIQGFELEALRGAETLFGFTELFIVETSLFSFLDGTPIISEVIQFMQGKGYELYDIAGFAHRTLDGALAQLDVVFAKKNGILRNSNEWN